MSNKTNPRPGLKGPKWYEAVDYLNAHRNDPPPLVSPFADTNQRIIAESVKVVARWRVSGAIK